MHIALVDGAALADKEVTAVGRPEDAVGIFFAYRAVLAEHFFLRIGLPRRMQHHIVAFDIRLGPAVGRQHWHGEFLLIHFHPVPLLMPPETGLGHLCRRGRDRFLEQGICIVVVVLRSVGCVDPVTEHMGAVFPSHIVRPVIDIGRFQLVI